MNGLPISDRERWLLHACLREGPAVREAFNAWRAFANPDEMLGRELRLMPILLANLRRAGIVDPAMNWLGGQAKIIWLTGSLRLRAIERALNALATVALPSVLIKGSALLARWPGEMELRPMGDVDLLVPCNRVFEAIMALRSAGFDSPAARQFVDADLAVAHGVPLTTEGGIYLDLHWTPTAMIGDPAYGESVFARSVEAQSGRTQVRVMSLTDHLFVVLFHAFDNVGTQGFEWVADVSLMLRRADPDEWNWRLYRSLCRRYRIEAWSRRALSLVEQVSGDSLPKGAPNATRSWAGWILPLQQREIQLRGRPALSVPDRIARWRGERARKRRFVYDHPEAAPKEAFLHALKSRTPSNLAAIDLEGFDLPKQPGGGSFLFGWSVPEDGGRWTERENAMLALRVPCGSPGDAAESHISLIPFVCNAAPELNVKVWAGSETVRWSFTQGKSDVVVQRSLRARLVGWRGEAILPLIFRFEDFATRERNLAGRDGRPLGIFLQRIDLTIFSQLPTFYRPLSLADPDALLVTGTGWGPIEKDQGRWSIAREAQLRFRLPQRGAPMPRAIRLVLNHGFSGTPGGQRIEVLLNGARALDTRLGAEHDALGLIPGGLLDILVAPETRPGSVVDLRLRFGSPASPQSLYGSGDLRNLGVFLTHMIPLF